MDKTLSEIYSKRAKKVFDAIVSVNHGDFVLNILAKRAARTITAYDAGFMMGNQPLASFLLVGSPFSPVLRVVEAIANSWIGKPFGPNISFTHINCGAYSMPHPLILSDLVGPLPADAAGRRPEPRLSQIDYPHFLVREKEMAEKISSWKISFLEEQKINILRIGHAYEHQFRLEIDGLASREKRKLFENSKIKEPFNSVVFFDAVNLGNASLIEIIRNIIMTGKAAIFPDQIIDFSRAMVILSVYDHGEILRNEIGFSDYETNDRQDHGKIYELAKKKLILIPQISSFVKDLGNNIFVINEISEKSQGTIIKEKLEEIKERCENAGIKIVFSGKFIDDFIKETHDLVLKIYTEKRASVSLEKRVIFALAQLVLTRRVKKGCEIKFHGAKKDFEAEVLTKGDKEFGANEILKVFPVNLTVRRPISELLEDDKDGPVNKMNESATELLKKFYEGTRR